MRRIIIIVVILLSGNAWALPEYPAYPDYEVPSQFWTVQEFVPVGYLRSYPIKNNKKILNEVQKKKLACLFIAAEMSSQEKYNQTHLIEFNTPIVQLLFTNFSQLHSMKWEGKNSTSGGALALSSIATRLSAMFNCNNSLNKSLKKGRLASPAAP